MNQEIELKFQIDNDNIPPFIEFMNSLTLLEQANLCLKNTYYDTHDSYLKRHKSSIRVRSTIANNHPIQFEITMKSAGQAIAGLHQRAEFNAALTDEKLNLNALPQDSFPSDCNVNALSQQLEAIFHTDFNRQIWLVEFNHSQIELALDRGTIANQSTSIPIQEVELELKQGNQTDLLLFALQLTQFKLHLFSQSKAARGYRLQQGSHLSKMDHNVEPQLFAKDRLNYILQYWQTNEEYALAYQDLNDYQTTLMQVKHDLASIISHCDPIQYHALIQQYNEWSQLINSMTAVNNFAYHPLNNQLKLHLMLLL